MAFEFNTCKLSDGKEMAGIFIYTASGDSEGTLDRGPEKGRQTAVPGHEPEGVRSGI